ncbi:unnamed protein product [Ostreobium quekettii]|uniref:NTF2 domain-containing protein n=1 Tax=Ostreobium quekettii TaxID=121088 RepID=A0A8S1IRJ9_9CHLO|nr:unnamed protein product [Ostreobium quekettii]
MADAEAVAKAFCEHYYNTFATNRQALHSLYHASSVMTFEGAKCQGQDQIVQKLTSLPFAQVKHQRDSLDVQPSPGGGILVFVTGKLMTEGQSNPTRFSQTFHLAQMGQSFVVTNGG